MPNIASSIQEYCKKINSRLTYFDIISISLIVSGIIFLSLYFQYSERKKYTDVIYQEGKNLGLDVQKDRGLPFGSKTGKTYTFFWCQGSSRIKETNKIIFSNEEEASKAGRTLSKLCQK